MDKQHRHPICPEGFHNFKIVKADERTSRNGNEYFLIALENTAHNLAYVWEIILSDPKCPPLSENALAFTMDRLHGFLRAIGLFEEAQRRAIRPTEMIGRKLSAEIIHKPNEQRGGELQAKVKGITWGEYDRLHDEAVRGDEPTDDSPKDADQSPDEGKSYAHTWPGRKGHERKREPQAPREPLNDDIPF